VRQYSSDPKQLTLPPPNVPSYWLAPPDQLTTESGLNRFVWDLRYPSPSALPYSYSGGLLEYTEYTLADHAIPGATPAKQPQGPLVVPGTYTAELEIEGKTYRQPLTVTLDPRVNASNDALERQLHLARQIAQGMDVSFRAYHEVDDLKRALAERKKQLEDPRSKTLNDQVEALDKKLGDLLSGPKKSPGFGPVNRDLTRLVTGVESADVAPAETAISAVQENCKALATDLEKWRVINSDLTGLNSAFAKSRLAPLTVAQVSSKGCGD
jgi:hypothetical protein